MDFFLSELKMKSSEMMAAILGDHKDSITKITDEKGYTLLHHAVLVAIDGKVKYLVDYAKNQGATE